MGYRLRVTGYGLWAIGLLAVVLTACSHVPETEVSVRACASMPNGGVACACACVCDGKAYVFGGRDSAGTYQNKMWCYDPQTDNWTSLGAAPFKARVNATMAAVDDKVYVGLGYSALRAYNDSAYRKDWWEYTPSTHTWQQKANYPNKNTVAATSYVIDGDIYAIYGFGNHYSKQICRYSPTDNIWAEPIDASNPAPYYHFGGRGALHNGMVYFGMGYTTNGNIRDWCEADLKTNTWTKRASVPGKSRAFGACAGNADYIYVFGGRHFAGEFTGGEVFDSYMRYLPEKDSWEWCGTMPCGRAENLIAFSINGKIYFGLGENENGKVVDALYRIED